MGTSIHAFVEIDYTNGGEPFSILDNVKAFNSGEFWIPRNYELFDALGNGRISSIGDVDVSKECLYGPKGIPNNLSVDVFYRYCHLVRDMQLEKTPHFQPWIERTFADVPGLPDVSTEAAQKWVAEGKSKYFESLYGKRSLKQQLRYVSSPSWHTPSWLAMHEIVESLNHFGLAIKNAGLEMEIILELMRGFERQLGSGHTRFVFWFDS